MTALVVTLTFAMAVSYLLPYALGALGPFLVAELKLSRAALGSLTTMMFVVAGVVSPLAGPMVDRLGGRAMLLATFAAGSVAAAAAAAAPSYGPLLVAAAVGGVAVAMGNPATNQLIAGAVAPARQGLAVGLKQSGVQVGAFAAGAALPAIAAVAGWRVALVVTAAVGAAGGFVTVATVPGARRVAAASACRAGRLPPAVAWLSLYGGLMGVGSGAVTAHLPLYAVERLGFDVAAAGLVAAWIGVVGVAARIGWGQAAPRNTGAALALLALGAVTATGLLAVAGAGGAAWLWAGAALFGATAIAWNAVVMLAVVRDVDLRLSGSASGRVQLGFLLGFVIGPVAFGWSVDRTGSYTLAWAGLLAAFAAAAALAWAQRGRRVRSAERHLPSR